MIAALFAATLAAAAPQATASPPPAGPPPALKPARVIGPGIYVRDLEAQKAWYMAKFGMAVLVAYPQFHEYVLGFAGGGPNGAILNLQASDQRPAGPNHNSRLILAVPNAKGLAAWLTTQGVETHEALPNVAYFLNDPEGNPIELYTPPARPAQ